MSKECTISSPAHVKHKQNTRNQRLLELSREKQQGYKEPEARNIDGRSKENAQEQPRAVALGTSKLRENTTKDRYNTVSLMSMPSCMKPLCSGQLGDSYG